MNGRKHFINGKPLNVEKAHTRPVAQPAATSGNTGPGATPSGISSSQRFALTPKNLVEQTAVQRTAAAVYIPCLPDTEITATQQYRTELTRFHTNKKEYFHIPGLVSKM